MRVRLQTVALIGVAATAIAVAVVWTVNTQEEGRAWTCMGNVYALGSLLDMYCADNDGRYPPAERWVDSVRGDLRDASRLKCPEDRSPARCSYGMNAELGGKRLQELAYLTSPVLVYETRSPGDDPYGGVDDVVSPPRHRGGNVYYTCTSFGAGQWARPGAPASFEVRPKR